MKIVFSRKGFDSASGGAPSPIIKGRPVSIPIPATHRSQTTYGHLGLGAVVREITRNCFTENSLCHCDPMFQGHKCAFGQTSAAQSHLTNNNVGVGDVFLFFGLFSGIDGKHRHHRIFGFLQVERVLHLGANPKLEDQPPGFEIQHPHTIGVWSPNNTIYLGPGKTAKKSHSELSLSVPGNQVSKWKIPHWLKNTGLTYHGRRDRWGDDYTLQVVPRGQEFITDITGNYDAYGWLEKILSIIFRDQS